MRNDTRLVFNRYLEQQATLNGVSDASKKFNVDPTVAQKLEDRIQESADFLKSINIVPVDEQSGQKLGLSMSGPIAGRTDTTLKDRETRDVHALDPDGYECKQTNFDTHLKYSILDMWAKFPEFQQRIRDHVTKQQARDRLTIGFNGTSHAADTDIATNTMLQDVNIGWLEKIRVNASERVISGLKIGNEADADYKTMDAAVYDLLYNLIEPWHRQDTSLRVITDSDLVSDKYLGLLNNNDAPTERAALETIMLNKQLGGRPAEVVPFFPTRTLLVTAPSNLSIYWQSGSRRRNVVENAKRDQIEDYQSVNEAYVVEDYAAAGIFEGILLPDGAGGWA